MILEFLDFEYAEAKKVGEGIPKMPKSINANIDIRNATIKNNVMKLSFTYLAKYVPEGSYVRVDGRARFRGPEVKSAYNEWKTTRRVTGAVGEQILNAINYSSSINSIFITRVFNLAPPIIPPTIKFEQPKKKKK
jgi:hypothetical protein